MDILDKLEQRKLSASDKIELSQEEMIEYSSLLAGKDSTKPMFYYDGYELKVKDYAPHKNI